MENRKICSKAYKRKQRAKLLLARQQRQQLGSIRSGGGGGGWGGGYSVRGPLLPTGTTATTAFENEAAIPGDGE